MAGKVLRKIGPVAGVGLAWQVGTEGLEKTAVEVTISMLEVLSELASRVLPALRPETQGETEDGWIEAWADGEHKVVRAGKGRRAQSGRPAAVAKMEDPVAEGTRALAGDGNGSGEGAQGDGNNSHEGDQEREIAEMLEQIQRRKRGLGYLEVPFARYEATYQALVKAASVEDTSSGNSPMLPAGEGWSGSDEELMHRFRYLTNQLLPGDGPDDSLNANQRWREADATNWREFYEQLPDDLGIPQGARQSFPRAISEAYLAAMHAFFDRRAQSRYYRWIGARALLHLLTDGRRLEREALSGVRPRGSYPPIPFWSSFEARRAYLDRYGVGVVGELGILKEDEVFALYDAGNAYYDARFPEKGSHGNYSHLDQVGIFAAPVDAAMRDHGGAKTFMRVLGHAYQRDSVNLRRFLDGLEPSASPNSPHRFHDFARRFFEAWHHELGPLPREPTP